MEDFTAQRHLALDYAVRLYSHDFDGSPELRSSLLETAREIFEFMTGPLLLLVSYGQVVNQETGEPANYSVKGSHMQLRETDQVDLTVQVLSVKGSPIADRPGDTSDDLLWSITDSSVATLLVSEDTRTCTVVAGVPGTADLTVALGELTARLAVDCVPGDAAVLTINEGTPVPQPGSGAEPLT